MHKLEKLILEAYGQLLTEIDGGRLFDYFSTKYHVKDHFHSDNSYIVQRKSDSNDQYVIFDFDKDKDQFFIRQLGGYHIDDGEAGEAGMNGKGGSRVAGIESYYTDGNYSPEEISAEGLKKIVDHVMAGFESYAKSFADFYKDRGRTSGTIDEDDESFDLEKEFEDNPRLTKFKDLPADMQKKFSKEIKVFGKNAPGDPNRDYVDSDYETYYFTTSYNKETGSVGHRLVKLPSYAKLYNSFSKIVNDIKTLMRVDSVKSDEQAKALFEDIKTLFRQLQRYLRTNHPKQYDLMKMRRMAEGLKKVKTLLEKMDVNDPVMLKVRRAKMHSDQMKKLDAYKKSPEGKAASRAQASAERKEVKGRELVRKLKIKRAQVMSDMENDPEIEPTGGPVADMYGDQLNKIDNAIEKAASLYNKNMSYDQAVGKINEFVGKELEDRNEPLYDKLVPGDGDAKTVEGEMLRAINRIIYRYYNDGDEYFRGYGTETAGPAHSFLVNANHPLKSAMIKVFKEGTDYEQTIKDALVIILDHIESKQGKYTKNTLGGIFDYEPEFEDEEDEYDDYYDDDDDDYYQEGKGQKISKSNMDGYKKGNLSLAESLLDDIKEQEEPEPEQEGDVDAPKETVLEDATDQILSKFPTLRSAIIKLQTEDFKEFVDTIDWISPRPTEFRINLKNGQDYILKWTGKSFEAQIMGKRYFIDKIDDYQQALDKLAILYKEGPMSGAGEEAADAGGLGGDTGGGSGGDFPGDDAGGGGGGGLGDDDAGGGLGDETPADDAGGADLSGEPVDFEEPAEEPES